ncbi:MAG: CAAX prenyl protease-related protein [Lacipirellulaceae bacterium]
MPFFSRENWLLYVLPMAVYMVLGSFEPAAPEPGEDPTPGFLGLTHDHYPLIYTAKLAIVVAALAFCWPAWGQWKLRVSPLAVGVGVVGVVLWIALCGLKAEERLLELLGDESPLTGLLGVLGIGAARAAYNPWEQLGHAPLLCWAFLVVRFLGLSVVVPVFEELMLRGWMMRNVVSPEFWKVEFGRVTTTAVVAGTAFPMLYHPEKLASLGWFTLVTWLMVRTKNYWDCVTAHAVTNFLLGVYVVTTGEWWLW